MGVDILGIRHHGPGSSRSVLDALNSIKPDIILIEGPPEGEAILSWAGSSEMKPPVALLAYVPDNPRKAVFYPFTEYSPEWNAIQYGIKNNIPIRFIDIPLSNKLAIHEKEEEAELTEIEKEIRSNPMSHLAEIAGFEDAEEWWEHQFELTQHPVGTFEAVAASMKILRDEFPDDDHVEKIREAFMRQGIRKAEKEMYAAIVVICGAWHVSALQNMPKQKDDTELIKNLPKIKTEATWIPWTNNRLSFESGYGAGVNSPGWYQHIWNNPADDGVRWLSLTAQIFRKEKTDISSAHIIEAVRLSSALASIRNLSRPGLKEHLESTQTVMCMGDDIPMRIIWKELIVGKQMGEIPEGSPQVPIQSDFEKSVKSLRLKISNEIKPLSLDLRENDHLKKSVLLHRLLVLDVNWATPLNAKGKGTFKEEWNLCWEPEMTINLLEKAVWGNTIESAANHYLSHVAEITTNLKEITELVKFALPAELHDGITAGIKKMDELAASTSDISLLMETFNPLVQMTRYGNVRNTDLSTVSIILESVFYRMLSNLPSGSTNIDDETATELSEKIKKVNTSILVLDNDSFKSDWIATLKRIIETDRAAAIIHGTCCKIIYDLKLFEEEEAEQEFSKALSVNNNPDYSAGWIEGFLKDGASTLLFDDSIWMLINNWIKSLNEETFLTIIPLLRRTFSAYNPVEKRKIASRVTQVRSGKEEIINEKNFNKERADKVLPVIEKLLGI